ncbi:MAG: hypothetical protein HYV09_16690 [Deltaproteobacteria bacterium]|nr:hypothetical protein [Deltaproteobacteria bacterium]
MELRNRTILLAGTFSLLGLLWGCGAGTSDPPVTEEKESTDQVDQAQHQDNDGNDPFKKKRCPPGKVEGSDPGECPEGHQ